MIDDGYPIVKEFKAEKGVRVGKLILLEKFRENNRTYWKCKCDCGKIVNKRQDNLSAGARGLKGGTRSCGCKSENIFKKRNEGVKKEDLTGSIINGMKLLSKTNKQDNNRSFYYWVECPFCHNVYLQSIRHIKDGHFKKHCGCLKNKSFNEEKINQLLEVDNISFIEQYIFPDCKYKNQLMFDFYVNNQYIIEYDGKQHFEIIDFFGGEEEFKKQRERDLIKNKYCFDHNIPLIRIPYNAEYTLDDLKLETTRFLLTPENEKEYYNNV